MRLGERRVSAAKSKDIKLTIEYVDKHGEPVKRGFLIEATATDAEVAEAFMAIVNTFKMARGEMS